MSRKIRVLIADDRATLRGELLRLIAAHADLEVVGEVEVGAEVVGRTAELAPDVVLLDLAMPGVGLPALERLAGRCPGTRTVVLAEHENISLLRSVLAEGSLGYVVPRSSFTELLSVIRQVADRRAAPKVPAGPRRTRSGPDARSAKDRELYAQHESLSQREQEVLRAVAYGYTNREIAEHLGISIKSVETYRYRVAEKLGFRSRVDLVRFALGTGLLRIDGEGLQDPSRSAPTRSAPTPGVAECAQVRPFST